MWKGSPCLIVGGGPSLKNIDWPRLNGARTIAINRAYLEFAPSIIFGSDERFLSWVAADMLAPGCKKAWMNSKSLKVWLDTTKYSDLAEGPLANWHDYTAKMSGSKDLGESLDDGLALGKNSGFAALNLAYILGANPIYLLGFDMKGDGAGNQEWFHNGYPEKVDPSMYPDVYVPHFERVAESLEKAGVQVVNLSPESALECFPKGDVPWNTLVRKTVMIQPMVARSRIKSEPPAGSVFIEGQLGFGDNLNHRPLVRDLAYRFKTVYVRTPIPEIYHDIPGVRFVRPETRLRTQSINEERNQGNWYEMPEGFPDMTVLHSLDRYLEGLSVQDLISRSMDSPYNFEFPLQKDWLDDAQVVIDGLDTGGRKICVVKRPTVRKEWPCPARNPDIAHYQTIIDAHKDEYFFVSVHHCEPGEEWFVGELEGIDATFDAGELPFTTICGLVKLSEMVLCYPSFMMLLGISQRTKTFCIFGGMMPPGMVVSDIMGLDDFSYVAPSPFCECHKPQHDCNLDIPEKEVLEAFDALKDSRPSGIFTLGLCSGIGDLHWVLTKLEAFKRSRNIRQLRVAIDQDSGHQSSVRFLQSIPFIDEVIQTRETFPWRWDLPPSERKMVHEGADSVDGVDMLLEWNSWLEQGKRLEDMMPELHTNWRYNIPYAREDREYADAIRELVGGRLVLLYPSSAGANKSWGKGWKPSDWVEIGQAILEETGSKPVLIGAQWDLDYSKVLDTLNDSGVFHNMIGRTDDPKRVFALIREAELMIGLASGMPIMATHFRTPTIMLWPGSERFDPDFQTAWVNPSVLAAGEYVSLTYGKNATVPIITRYALQALRYGGMSRSPHVEFDVDDRSREEASP